MRQVRQYIGIPAAAAAVTSSADVYRERAKKEKQEEVDDN